MLKEILNFGDTFRYAEKEYVYLAQVGDLVYALLILSEESTKND